MDPNIFFILIDIVNKLILKLNLMLIIMLLVVGIKPRIFQSQASKANRHIASGIFIDFKDYPLLF